MRVRMLDSLDPIFAWDGVRLLTDDDLRPPTPVPAQARGAFAVAGGDPGRYRLARDPLGLNKLFWATESPDSVVVAARPYRLVRDGRPFGSIRSFPRAGILDVDGAGARFERSPALPAPPGPRGAAALSMADVAVAVREALDGYLAALAAAHPGVRAVVCCSGGLDSSGILALVGLHFPDVLGVSFDFDRSGRHVSEDRRTAQRLCHDLDVPLLEADVTPERLLELVDTVLLEGCDWREFNVHAALVNAALATEIARSVPAPVIVFTGDLANELLADYHEETYRGGTYYRLPRLAPGALRDSLVHGLDSTNREIGVFGAFGLPVVQPYAVAVDPYLHLDDGFLARADAKQELCRAVFGDLLPGYVLERPKVRAQIGDPGAGTGVLAACVDRGLDQRELRSRFAHLHGIDPGSVDRFIRAGRYRSAVPSQEELGR